MAYAERTEVPSAMADQMQKTIYVTIGSDGDSKLTQSRWSDLYWHAVTAITKHAEDIHGAWASDPTGHKRSACWCITPFDGHEPALRSRLAHLAHEFGEPIRWAETTTELIKPDKPSSSWPPVMTGV